MLKYLICLLLPLSVYSQRIEDYVKSNTSPIAAIDPDSTDFTDLAPIGQAIGNARVVFLGEQDHGDAPTFLAKTRLIKYLHEKMGFDVLAFESDIHSLNYGWDHVDKNTDSIRLFIRSAVFGVWSGCDACRELLYHYIPATWQSGKPLTVSGFDNQIGLFYSYRHFVDTYDSILRHYELPITRSPGYEKDLLPLIRVFFGPQPAKGDTIGYIRRDSTLRQIRQQLAGNIGADDYWMLITDNLIQYNSQEKYKSNYYVNRAIRDIQMAKNLDWLCKKKFPGHKIIVWAHNYHISKYNGHYPVDFLNSAHTMGDVFTSMGDNEKETYIMGFTSYEGEAGMISQKQYTLPKLDKESYENWVGKELPYAFTDFRKYNREHADAHDLFNLSGSVMGTFHHTWHKAEWNRVFDGVFFIRHMYACKIKSTATFD